MNGTTSTSSSVVVVNSRSHHHNNSSTSRRRSSSSSNNMRRRSGAGPVTVAGNNDRHSSQEVAFPFLLGGALHGGVYGGVMFGGDNSASSSSHQGGGGGGGGGGRANNNINNDKSSNHLIIGLSERNITRAVVILRTTVFVLLVMTATFLSVGVYIYTKNVEQTQFQQEYHRNAIRVLDSFHQAIERRLNAIDAMANSITSYVMATNQTFPFVTIPDFALRGADLRIQATNPELHWLPLVTDEKRLEWEAYALQNRFQIDVAFQQDQEMRQWQDEMLGFGDSDDDADESDGGAQQSITTLEEEEEDNILKDGSGFHPRIHSNGDITPKGDEANGTGPFLPLWQRSPINELKQKTLNRNFANTKIFHGMLPAVLQTKEAIMNRITVPSPNAKVNVKMNLQSSQYRHVVDENVNDPLSFLAYPVFDSFLPSTRQLGGVLAMNIYWKLLFENILSPSPAVVGLICVLDNSYEQVMSYRIDGADATFLGMIDAHDEQQSNDDDLVVVADINSYLQSNQTTHPEMKRSYMAVPLNAEYGQYTLRIYPTQQDTQDDSYVVYTIIVVLAFACTAIIFCCFVVAVEERQEVVMSSAVDNAQKAAAMERELNLFLAHEVRNPLSAAMSACTFVTDTCKLLQFDNNDISANDKGQQEQYKKSLQEDSKIIRSSLEFIDEFLRSMLDMHRAADNRLKLTFAPTDLLRDVLEPVSSMLHQHDGASVNISVHCPENLIIMTDALRLKQVMLNLGRNATRFIESGFIRLRATVVESDEESGGGGVELCVEDSGKGIPPNKRQELFQKFHTSLDVLDQGTGIGLCLCQNFMVLLDGDIWLDEDYTSGVEGSPGARFVIQLNSQPLSINEAMRRVSMAEEVNKSPFAEIIRSAMFDDDEDDENDAGIVATADGDSHDGPFVDKDMGGGASGDFHATCNAADTVTNDSHTVTSSDTPATASVDDHGMVDANSMHSNCSINGNNYASDNCVPDRQKQEVGQNLPENLSVLFVDDDLVLRKLFARALKRVAPSWKIKEAACGEAALRLVLGDEESQQEPQHFDVIWMDQYMPSMQRQLLGTETIRSLRASGIQSRICGLSANDIEEAFLQAGADCFMLKPMPCDKDELKRKLFGVLGMKTGNMT